MIKAHDVRKRAADVDTDAKSVGMAHSCVTHYY